jgi:hypothetical protein
VLTHMVHDKDLERLKVRRENHVRCVKGMWQRVRELKNYEEEPCALTHGYVPVNKRAESYKGQPCALTHGVCASK